MRQHLRVLLREIYSQRLIDLSTMSINGGCSSFYSLTLANAYRLRESISLFNKARLDALIISHNWLLKNLSVPLIASYLNLLRFLKAAVCFFCSNIFYIYFRVVI